MDAHNQTWQRQGRQGSSSSSSHPHNHHIPYQPNEEDPLHTHQPLPYHTSAPYDHWTGDPPLSVGSSNMAYGRQSRPEMPNSNSLSSGESSTRLETPRDPPHTQLERQGSDPTLDDNSQDEHQDSGASSKSKSNSNSNPTVPGPSLKRGMACGFCRRRKLRCSGTRPVCTNCEKFNKVCEYGQPSKAAMNEYIQHVGPGPDMIPSAFSSAPLPHPHGTGLGDAGDSYFGPTGSLLDPSTTVYSQTGLQQPFAPDFTFASLTGLDSTPPQSFSGWSTHPGVSVGSLTQAQLSPDSFLQGSGLSSSEYATPYTQQYVNPAAVLPPASAPPVLPTQSTPQQNEYPFLPEMGASSYTTPVQLEGQAHPTPPMQSAVLQAQALGLRRPSIQLPSKSHQSTPISSSSDLLVSPAPHSTKPADGRDVTLLYSGAEPEMTTDVDSLTERLGEFLFSPNESVIEEPTMAKRKRSLKPFKSRVPSGRNGEGGSSSRAESDGLTDAQRQIHLDIFLQNHKLFFDMSIPRFKYRMTFNDRRRPSLAFLHAIYLWTTRMMHPGPPTAAETFHFQAACKHMNASAAMGDRLLDTIRAAMLIATHSYTRGHNHQGWLAAGYAMTLCASTGLHRIPSCIFNPEPPQNPLLRQRVFLLPPPEDALELGERIHLFWSCYAIDRCGALATGFPSSIRDEDITTPWPRPLFDIASGTVSARDDLTVRDLYRKSSDITGVSNAPYIRWLQCTALLERASKLALAEAEEDSEHTRQWNNYRLAQHPAPAPPAWLEQPKYRNPKASAEIRHGLEFFYSTWGDDGVFPVDRKRKAVMDGGNEPDIPAKVVVLHHMLAGTHLLLHDVNALEAENKEALIGARKSVLLLREMAPMPDTEVEPIVILVWSMVTKTLLREMHRLRLAGDIMGSTTCEEDANVVIAELLRIGAHNHVSRTHANAMDSLKRHVINTTSGLASVASSQAPVFTMPFARPGEYYQQY